MNTHNNEKRKFTTHKHSTHWSKSINLDLPKQLIRVDIQVVHVRLVFDPMQNVIYVHTVLIQHQQLNTTHQMHLTSLVFALP